VWAGESYVVERIARAAGRVGGVGYTPLRGCGQVNPMSLGAPRLNRQS